MTTSEVQDFGFSDSPVAYSNLRSPGAATNGTPRPGIHDDDIDQGFFSTGLGDAPLEMFKVERAQLNLNITIHQLVISNNILIMASTDSKIYKIDLTLQEQIIEMELQKKHGENKKISKIFLDIHGDHLLVNTEAGETFYFSVRNIRTGRGRPVSRLNNIHIESIAWSTDATAASTKEILIGTRDGAILETYLEISDYIPNARYLRQLRNVGTTVIGLHVEKSGELRDVFVASHSGLSIYSGRVTRKPGGDISSIYATFFDEANSGQFQELSGSSSVPKIAVLPRSATDVRSGQRHAYFAWATSPGLFHGNINTAKSAGDDSIFSDATLLPYSTLFSPVSEGKPILLELSQFHLLILHENQLVAVNRLNNRVVFNEPIPTKPGEKFTGIVADHTANTYWVYSDTSVSEIVVTDEDRELWEIYLEKKSFTAALSFAKNDFQRNSITTAEADALALQGEYKKAASLYARCSKPFEEVALVFVDQHETDALRLYLTQKLVNLGRTALIQRTMVSTWAIELFLDKLNSLEDSATNSSNSIIQQNLRSEAETVRSEFQEFITKHKKDLDRQTTYDLINSHGRQTELLYFATSINDHKYVLNYWINREDWAHAIESLRKQTSPEVFYKSASVLLLHAPQETVNVWVQQRDLDPTKLTPALLQYNESLNTSLEKNQAIRYLVFAIDHLGSTDSSVHNALISIYASHRGKEEDLLLKYLRSQPNPPYYDVDFALRLCLQFHRVQSGVHIYSSMELFEQGVALALDHDEFDLAIDIADSPDEDPVRRKKLWLSIAEKVISQKDGMKKALDLLQRCDLLKIEDLVPLFPDFMAIDDFKDEICSALEEYSHQVDRLKHQMDDSARSSQSIQSGIADLGRRYAVIQAGESCSICGYPLLTRQFYIFPCRHAFHTDCLVNKLKEEGNVTLKRRINEVQGELGRSGSDDVRKKAMEEFDAVVAGECVLCGDLMFKSIDVGFNGDKNELEGWTI